MNPPSKHQWIECGAKLNLATTPDADVLKSIVIKLQKRVTSGAATLLVKVKPHRGYTHSMKRISKQKECEDSKITGAETV